MLRGLKSELASEEFTYPNYRGHMSDFTEWATGDAAALIARPARGDDKYSRGVLGIITGSDRYPGAAVLGVEAALRTGVGMVRYLGPQRPSDLVLQRRPEAVTAPGPVQAWLLGSGMDPLDRDSETMAQLRTALESGAPLVLDSGALDLVRETLSPRVITPHYRELARLLSLETAEVAAEPSRWAGIAADRLGVTVLLKGSVSYIAGSDGTRLMCGPATPWLATAGTGDALAGILGALLATHADDTAIDGWVLARLAATASVIHARAAARASGGGPFTVLDLTDALPATVAGLIA